MGSSTSWAHLYKQIKIINIKQMVKMDGSIKRLQKCVKDLKSLNKLKHVKWLKTDMNNKANPR